MAVHQLNGRRDDSQSQGTQTNSWCIDLGKFSDEIF